MSTTTMPPISEHQEYMKAYKAGVSTRYSELFKDLTREEVWFEYRTNPSTKIKEKALEELLARQNGMIVGIARYVHRAHSQVAKLEDFIGHARYAAMQAYERYDPYTNNSLNTYVWAYVQPSLMTIADDTGTIRCRSGQRSYRTYFNGGYDNNPEKKDAFEKRFHNTLGNEKKRMKKQAQVNIINAEVISYDNFITTDDGQVVEREFSPSFSDEPQESIIEKIDWSNAVNKMSSLQKKVYKMFFIDQYSVKEIAEEIQLTEKEIKQQVRLIKIYFKRTFPEYAV